MTDLQSCVLRIVNGCCTTDSGFYTGEIADRMGRQPGHETNRQHSALVGRTLRELHQMGLVRHLDDQKPVVWCRA